MDAELQRTIDEVNRGLALISEGDPSAYQACWAPSSDSTLLGAWGTVERGQRAIAQTLDWVAHRFSGGTLVPSYEIVHASIDLAYTVGTERGVVTVDGGSEAEMTIRVTHVFRKLADGRWYLVHRHADYPPPRPLRENQRVESDTA